jgi:hypothetical protein
MRWFHAVLNLVGLGKDIIVAKSDLKVAEVKARAEVASERITAQANWEASAAQNSAKSWLDEWWTFVLSLPLIAAFIPWAVPYVHAGFKALENVPEWYVWAVLASVSFAFARKKLPDLASWRRKPAE